MIDTTHEPRSGTPPTVARGAPLYLAHSTAPSRKGYIVIIPPHPSRIDSPTHRTSRYGDRCLEPHSKKKLLYSRTRTVAIVFDGWPRHETALPEQEAVLVDFLCPSKSYIAAQVLNNIDLVLTSRSDGIPSFHWQINTGPKMWTMLTSKDDVPDFGSDDAILRVTAVQRRS